MTYVSKNETETFKLETLIKSRDIWTLTGKNEKIFDFRTIMRRCEFMCLDEYISKNQQFARSAYDESRATLFCKIDRQILK